ncbi:hypothetical protein PFISCL1PPCAC_21332, partial [Pristionchus fissidentatus]
IDEIARSSKQNLKSTLIVAHQLSYNSRSPSDFLFNRMNAVLGTIVETNFSSSSLGRVGELYEAIGKLQPALMDNSQNLALINFARSFAVVMEESIRREEKRGGNNQNQKRMDSWDRSVAGSNPLGAAAAIPSRQLGFGTTAARPAAHVQRAAAAAAAALAEIDSESVHIQILQNYFPKSFSKTKSATGATAAAAAATAARSAVKHPRPSDELDFSPEAVKGRVRVTNIPIVVGKDLLESFMKQIGPILSMSYPQKSDGTPKGFAFAKYASNEEADQAVKELSGMGLRGQKVTVARAEYWFKKNDPGTKKTIDNQPRSITTLEGPISSLKVMNKKEGEKEKGEKK